MARGRMINSRIAMDKAVNDLMDDTSRLAFTWLITFADSEGRTHGDPALVASMVFPRRRDVTPTLMMAYMVQWEAKGLIHYYEAEGDWWIEFPAFAKNQRGLDRRKEPDSIIPPPDGYVPSTEEARTEHVPSTAEEKRTEEKRTEVVTEQKASVPSTDDDELPAPNDVRLQISKAWSEARGGLTNSLDGQRLTELETEYGAQNVLDAIHEANSARTRGKHINLNFVTSILERWEQEGRDTPFDPHRVDTEQAKAAKAEATQKALEDWAAKSKREQEAKERKDAEWAKVTSAPGYVPREKPAILGISVEAGDREKHSSRSSKRRPPTAR